MAYPGLDWRNKPNTSSPLNAANLEIMDTGIFNNDRNLTGVISASNTALMVGAGNTFTRVSIPFTDFGIKMGIPYRIYIKSWDQSGVTTTGAELDKIRLKYKSGSDEVTFYYKYINQDLDEYVDYTFPEGLTNPELIISGRVTQDVRGALSIVEMSEDAALNSAIGGIDAKISNVGIDFNLSILFTNKNKAVNTSGNMVTASNYSTTGILKCCAGMSVTYSNLRSSVGYPVIITFDKNMNRKRYIDGQGWSTGLSGTFTFNANEFYFAMTVVSYNYSSYNYQISFTGAKYDNLAYSNDLNSKLNKTGYEKTIYKGIDLALKSGSFQPASASVSAQANAVGYTSKIVTSGTVKIHIPLVEGVDHYKYRFAAYKSDNTYTYISLTESNTYTIPDGYVSFAFGVYARDAQDQSADVNLYNLLNYIQVEFSADGEKEDYISVVELPDLVDDITSKSTKLLLKTSEVKTIYKGYDVKLKSGSLQVAYLSVSADIGAVAYLVRIPASGKIRIEMPKIEGVSYYKYRYGAYKSDLTYTQVISTTSNTYTIPDGYVTFAFGVYGYDSNNQEITFSLYDAVDLIQVYFEATDKRNDYVSAGDLPDMVDVLTQKKSDIVSLNTGIEVLLREAKRPINLSSYGYRSQTPPLTLLHFSDIHGDATELNRMVEFKAAYSSLIDDVICTGDVVETRWASDFTFWNSSALGENNNILLCMGNHDVLTDPSGFDWSQRASQADQYTRYFAPYIDLWNCAYESGKTYYYKDYATNKIRLIVLNCMLTGTDETDQLQWLEDTLADAITEELNVLVANHYMPINAQKISCNFCNLDKAVSDQYNTLPLSYLAKINDFIEGGGKFICHIAGHTHLDFVVRSTDYPEQIAVIVDALSREQGDQYSDGIRVNATKTQDLANLFTIDLSTKTIKIIRVGANMDHYLREKNAITINYETGAIVTQN